jgi:hypothetical protein
LGQYVQVQALWVAELRISSRTSEKINSLHGVTDQEVKDAVVCVQGLRYVWDDDPERGRRAIIETMIRRRPAYVVLYPTSDGWGDCWNLGSAYFTG